MARTGYHSERTGTNYGNQSATVFIIPNHGSEVLNRRDQRVLFSLEVARYLIDHAKGKKKTLWHPGYVGRGKYREGLSNPSILNMHVKNNFRQIHNNQCNRILL